jgi:diguanylate cyclase (GGDEF)-like protein
VDKPVHTETNLQGSNRFRRIIQSVSLAVVVDAVFVLVEIAAGLNPVADFKLHPWIYSYIYFGTIIVFGFFGYLIGTREDMLRDMAMTDGLTGLYNSRHLWTRIHDEFALAKRHETPLSILILDLDEFKSVNDSYGHPVGDHFLELMGRTINSIIRQGETGARVGGEEFAVLLPQATAQEAAVVAERIRKAIEGERMKVDNGEIGITASAGVACTVGNEAHSAEGIYQLADHALLQAKRTGRNRVVTVLPQGAPPNEE